MLRKHLIGEGLHTGRLGVFFEYTTSEVPQQHVRVEWKFAALYAILNGREFTLSHRNQLWVELAQTVTVLQNNLLSQQNLLIPYLQFFGKGRTSILDTIQICDEICVVADHVANMNTIQNQWKHCIWLGLLKIMLPKLSVIEFQDQANCDHWGCQFYWTNHRGWENKGPSNCSIGSRGDWCHWIRYWIWCT